MIKNNGLYIVKIKENDYISNRIVDGYFLNKTDSDFETLITLSESEKLELLIIKDEFIYSIYNEIGEDVYIIDNFDELMYRIKTLRSFGYLHDHEYPEKEAIVDVDLRGQIENKTDYKFIVKYSYANYLDICYFCVSATEKTYSICTSRKYPYLKFINERLNIK